MPRDEPDKQTNLPSSLTRPQISLVGRVDEQMVQRFAEQMGKAEDGEGDIVVEMTTLGGDAELGRRLALDVAEARERLNRRIVFLGKTAVYSAGVTVMAAFPREDRFLAADCVLLIHCRKLVEKVELSGPIRTSLPQLDALKAQIELGIKLEEASFRQLIEDSDVGLDALFEKALSDWYVTAEEAVRRRLVAGIAGP